MPTTNPTLYHPAGRGLSLKAVIGPSTGNVYLPTFDGTLETVQDADVPGLLSQGWNTRPPQYYQAQAVAQYGQG